MAFAAVTYVGFGTLTGCHPARFFGITTTPESSFRSESGIQ